MVGYGSKVHFWTDHWTGDAARSITFPTLFSLAQKGQCKVMEAANWSGFELLRGELLVVEKAVARLGTTARTTVDEPV